MAKSKEFIKLQESLHKIKEKFSDNAEKFLQEISKFGKVHVDKEGNGFIKLNKFDKANLLELDELADKYASNNDHDNNGVFGWSWGDAEDGDSCRTGDLHIYVGQVLSKEKDTIYFGLN